jgi:hypothetical protein
VAGEPLTHLWMLVEAVIVEDHVNELSGRHLRLNSIQEADELLMPMALHTSADDLAFEHVESSEQRRCAMALVVVGPTPVAGRARVASYRAADRRNQPRKLGGRGFGSSVMRMGRAERMTTSYNIT